MTTFPTYTDLNGIIRFESNNQIPFADYLEENHGLSGDVLASHVEAREIETTNLIRSIRAHRLANPMTEDEKAERAYELRAAFGPGETVVDLITGETFTS
jgi:hypothetical protein